MEDREIIKQVLSGDSDAFGLLVERYQNRIYSLALRITGNEDDACDMAQETFLRAWRSLSAFKFECAFSTWLFRLAHNICLDHLRAVKRRPAVSLTVADDDGEQAAQLDLPDPAPDPEQAALRAEEHAALARALSALPADYREILTLRAIDDLSYSEIAAILHLQEGTVKSRLSRARAQLRNKLLQNGNNSSSEASSLTERRVRDALR